MSTLRTFNLQNPDSGTVNIEMDQGGNTLMTGIATVRGAAHFTSTSGSDAVGIGTDITAYKLDVRVTGAEAGLRVYNPDTSSNASGIIRLGNDDNQNAAFLRLNGSNNTSAVGGAGSLVLGHGLSKDLHLSTAGVSRLKITSAGNVAIGHNSAPTKLGIRGTSASTDATVQIVGNGVSTLLLGQDAAGGVIRGQGGSNQLKFKVGGNGDDAAATGGVEALRITSAGDVGIGVADPDVYSLGGNNRYAAIKASAGYTVLNLVDSNNSGSYLQFGNPTVRRGSLHFDSASNFLVTINESGSGTNLTEKLRLDLNGRLTISGQGLKLNPTTSSLYTLDGSLSYYSTSNAVYLNGAGTNGWLRLNAAGTENNQNAINIFGGGAGAHIDMRTNGAERLRITSAGKIGINQSSPAGQVHIKGNTDESANPSIILDDNGDTRRCYITNTSGDLMLGGIDNGTVQSRLTIHENGNMYHQRLNSSGSLVYQFATYSSQTGGAASGNTYTEHMAFRGGSEGMRSGSFNMTIYGDGGDNYMPVLFTRHGYHPTNSSFGGQWFGEMWLNNAGSINPQNYNHTGYNNWATTSFKYRWDCAHWNAKPTMSIIEHHVNYGRTNIADLEISGTTSYFVMWLLPGIYRVTYSAWDGLNAWWTNNNNVGGPLTHREGGGNTTRAVRAYSARDTRYDSNISWGTQGQT